MNIVRDRTGRFIRKLIDRKEVANMWTRKSIKQKGKKCFYWNYWKAVLVALILSIIVGATSGAASGGSSGIGNSFSGLLYKNNTESDSQVVEYDDDTIPFDVDLDVDLDGDGNSTHITKDDDEFTAIAVGAIVVAVIVGLFVFAIIMAISLALRYLLFAPFEYGCRKFFRKNLDEPAKLSNLVYVFDSNYKNIVKTAFMKDLFIWLWSLLFVIPGIIKTYEYRLVPYIISEDPAMNYKDALAESKKLMKGNKWKAFVLDLSFIGWDILSALTLGLLEIFFVAPYKASTDAALYETLKYGIDAK